MKRLTAVCIVLLLLAMQTSSLLAAAPALPPRAPAPTPPSQESEDEGGPVSISGDVNYVSGIITVIAQEPVVALMNISGFVQRDDSQFAPIDGQVIGYLTSPLSPAPASYEIKLPIAPGGAFVDVDNDGESDTGVKVFSTLLAANINGGSFLEQLDQAGDLFSILRDRESNEITEGSLLIYAEDDQQAFPSNFGEDGLLFTEDDPTVPLQAGYTIARLAADGTITFDRSRDGRMDIIQLADAAWPDFSNLGLIESYNALIDLLAEDYAFTELRGLDWEEIRATYLPQAEAALEAQSIQAWDATLRSLAQFVRDAHVVSNGPGLALFEQPIAANLGANGVELSDGRIVVGPVAPGSPLDEAGIGVGSEIVSIDGQTVAERVPTVLYSDATGTEEGKRLRQVRNLLRFPADAQVELAYRLPDTTDVLTATLTAGAWPLGDPLATPRGVEEISYDMLDNFFGYVTWKDFQDPIPTVDTYKDFLRLLNERRLTPSLIESPGIIIDMRSNGGGWKTQYLTMGSYLFNQENPVAYNWSENASFNAETGAWERAFEPQWMLSAPDLAAYFPGEVVLLVDPSCASSCEFFSAFLQS
ncbi:MAG: S41 family peptidase, partial [Caldilineaceae bacterium]